MPLENSYGYDNMEKDECLTIIEIYEINKMLQIHIQLYSDLTSFNTLPFLSPHLFMSSLPLLVTVSPPCQ